MNTKNQTPSSVSKTVRLKKTLAERIEDMAVEQNRNFSNMLETLLLEHLSNDSNQRIQPLG